VKIYVAAVEVVLRKKERQDETKFITKILSWRCSGKRKDRMKLSLSPKF
jgi:hypothetical protein